MPVKNICQLFPQKKESLVTLSRLSRIRSIYFFSAKCTSSRSVFYVNKKDTSTYYAQILPYQTKSIWKCLIILDIFLFQNWLMFAGTCSHAYFVQLYSEIIRVSGFFIECLKFVS